MDVDGVEGRKSMSNKKEVKSLARKLREVVRSMDTGRDTSEEVAHLLGFVVYARAPDKAGEAPPIKRIYYPHYNSQEGGVPIWRNLGAANAFQQAVIAQSNGLRSPSHFMIKAIWTFGATSGPVTVIPRGIDESELTLGL